MIRTDIAEEAYRLFGGGFGQPEGVIAERESVNELISVQRITVCDERAARELGKQRGRYVSVCAEYAVNRDKAHHGALARTVARELAALLPPRRRLTLVVGLGNRQMTPDALGPKTLDNLMVTRHLFTLAPEAVDRRLSAVCALAPGVMASTGMESADIVASVADKVRPDLVIAVDSLAAAEPERINDTIQLSDAGISPGAGVGNRRQGISEERLGVPVIAIGIPVVVYASQLAGCEGVPDDLVVTPRTIDAIIEDCSRIIARGINLALHSGVTEEEIEEFLY